MPHEKNWLSTTNNVDGRKMINRIHKDIEMAIENDLIDKEILKIILINYFGIKQALGGEKE